jgi:aspartate/methionine/tyrosine aminotransferase
VTVPLILSKLLIRSGLARFLPVVQHRSGGAGDFLKYYSDRVLSAALAKRDTAWLDGLAPDVLDLALGAPRFDLLPSGSAKLPAEQRGLPPAWGLPELRHAVADKLHADNGLVIHPDREVLITLGVSGGFNLVLDAFVNPGDRVVLFDPTSPLYRGPLLQRRARIRWLRTWMEAGRTRFDPQALPQALRGARLVVVTSPANPTGGVLAAEDLERIVWWAERRDVLLFSDESFERYRPEGPAATVAMQPRAARRTLTAGSVSKGHALTAARVGWLAGHRHLVRPCAVTAALQAALVPTLCQQIALTALRQPMESFTAFRAEFDARRRYACERLRALGLAPEEGTGGFFLWLPVRELGLSGRAFAERLLTLKRVLVWPGEFFGPSGADHVRLSCAAEDGRFREGLTRLAELVQELRAVPPTERRRHAA